MTAPSRIGAVAVPPGVRVYAVLGDPVAHSLSPRMQQAALAALGLPGVYLACRVTAAELAGACSDLRALARDGRLGGANVTVPHKTSVLAWLDGLDAVAAALGAVNTITVQTPGPAARLYGFNTDAGGLVRALAEAGAPLGGARVVIVGAGGMGRAAVAAAQSAGAAEVFVGARRVEAAQTMLDALARHAPPVRPALACGSLEAAAARLRSADILVHATPLGLHPGDGVALPLDGAPARLCVCDTVYGAGPTPLLRAAQARGLRTVNGRVLLLHQGAAAFTLWTGAPAPLAAMRAALASPGAP